MRARIVYGAVLVAMTAGGVALAGTEGPGPAPVAVSAEPLAAPAMNAVARHQRRASRAAPRKPRRSVATRAARRRPQVRRTPVAPAPGHRPAADGLNWAALARCESGGNPRAIGGGGAYRGLYQFMLSTWHSVGGAGDPINASAGEQTYRAQLLYKRSGSRPWGACGSRLFT